MALRFVRVKDNNSSSSGGKCNKVRMLDRDVPAIRQMKIKRLKRLGMTQFADLVDRHTDKVFFVQSKGKWFSFQASRLRQCAGMSYLAFSNRPNLGCFHCHYGRRFPVQRGKFDFISQAIPIYMNHSSNVARLQCIGRDGRFQYDSLVFSYHIRPSFFTRVRRDQTWYFESHINNPNCTDQRCPAAGSVDAAIDNILCSVRGYHNL